MRSLLLAVLLLCSSLLTSTANADGPLFTDCPSNTNYTSGSPFQANLDALLSSLPAAAAVSSGFAKDVQGAAPDQAFGLAQCRADVNASYCRGCLDGSAQDMATKCPGQKDAVLIYDDCLLRHSNASFFGEADTSVRFFMWNTNNATEPTMEFTLGAMISTLTERAYESPRMFAVGEADVTPVVRIYGMAQCTRDLAADDCKRCLASAVSSIPNYGIVGKRGGRVICWSCSIRFEVYPFYDVQAAEAAMLPAPPAPGGRSVNGSDDHSGPGGHVQNKGNIKIILPTVIAFLLLLTCATLVWRYKYKAIGKQRKKEAQKRMVLEYLRSTDESGDKDIEFPFIRFEDIVMATNNFSDSNMLGKGGFGKVYKGLLDGTKEVAVKRLSKGSGQGIEEFRNEVVLIARLQHKNLVKLLGCCIHEAEKLLVYEYLPNKSLDYFLFDSARKALLQWPTRYKIIKGIARGILYLHQDSRLTIIHRDLKASNILLDNEMIPKISDFGMARIFCSDQHQANTNRVVGTYGYMSPEYAMEGAFSVKSDTYSFGILLLEIVSGLKISWPHLVTDFPNLIVYAWNLWNDDKTEHLVDSSVKENCPLDEVSRCIHIGLLCVQDSPESRPLISEVVSMLENKTTPLPIPMQPMCFARRNAEPGRGSDNTVLSLNCISFTDLEGR